MTHKELLHYGNIVADRQHETTDGHFIRFTTFSYKDELYVVTMYDGTAMLVSKKDCDIEF